MGHRTGTFFQMARGRAIVRGRSMNEARRLSRLRARIVAAATNLDAYQIAQQTGAFSTDYPVRDRETMILILGDRIRFAVERARRANKDWRSYRATSRELGEGD